MLLLTVLLLSSCYHIIRRLLVLVACSTLSANADKCGVNGCGDLTLTGILGTYRFAYGVINGDTTGALDYEWGTLWPLCYDVSQQRRQAKHNNTQALEELKQRNPNLAKAITNNGRNATLVNGDTVNVALSLFVLTGPVSIFSKKHGTNWASGWVDFMLPELTAEVSAEFIQQLEQQGNKVPRLDFSQLGKFKFQFYEKDQQY